VVAAKRGGGGIYRRVFGRMSAVNERLESAATTVVVAEVFATSALVLGRSEVLLLALFLFLWVHIGREVAGGGAGASSRERLYAGVLDRTQLVLLGLASRVAVSYSDFTSVQSVAVPGSVVVYKLGVLLCMLVFTAVLLHGNALAGLVSVVLYMVSDAIALLLESGDEGMLVPCVAFVLLVCSARVRPWVDGFVGGLGVVLDVVYMASVNWVLDLVADNSTEPLQHIALLVLLLFILEVCSAVEPTLRETQSYALFKVSSLVFAYFLSWRADAVCVLCIAVLALVVTRMSEWRATGYQLVVLVLLALITYEFNVMMSLTYGSVKLMSVTCLVVVLETVKVFSAGAAAKKT
jgi:hypothetical protein